MLRKLFALLLICTPCQAATHGVFYAAATGGTYYAYPAAQSLADWATYRVAMSEDGSPNVGRYTGTVDDAQGATWYLFSGATQPTSWGDAVAATSVIRKANVVQVSDDATAADNLELAADNYSATRGLAGTALPAAAADAAGGLAISDAGGLDLDAILADTAYLQPQLAVGGTLYDTIISDSTNLQSVYDVLPAGGKIIAAAGDTATDLDDISGVVTVSADVVSPQRTWFADDYRARNIVEVEANFAGTLALKPDLNPGAAVATVSSVSITGAATVTATDLTVDRSRTKAHFTVPALTTTGTYTVVVTITTVDGDTIPTTATLKVN